MSNWFSYDNSGYKIEQFEFSNGDTLSWQDISTLAENHQAEIESQSQFDLLAQEMASFGAEDEDSDLTGFNSHVDTYVYQD